METNTMQWWYEINGEQKGPVVDAEIKKLIADGSLKKDNLIWKEGLADWVTVGSIEFKPIDSLAKVQTELNVTSTSKENIGDILKWYNNQTKLWLSILLWPLFVYGLYKTKLYPKKTKQIIAGVSVLLLLISIANKSGGPTGKTYFLENRNGYGAYSFGNTSGKDNNFLNYSWTYYDYYGNATRTIRRTGYYTVDGNIIKCIFSDGEPPYKIKYDGDGWISDDQDNVFKYDDPAKRNN